MNVPTRFRPGARRATGALGWMALLAVLACAGAFSNSAPAQQNKKGGQATRNVQGVVHAPDGSPQAGAVVQLENKRTMQVRSFISRADGSYYFRDLNADVDYGLRAEYHGAASDRHTISTFDSRLDVTIDLQLRAAK
ncbi:MAG: carboxypeptidase-like regulatory domain-containing protein [Bryobacteraceae bacterium]